ncbi:hypothetical protein C0J52_16613 [Blattella germanica]|nr:hypothetical protein C0J52_16613 [Blattella germanica]
MLRTRSLVGIDRLTAVLWILLLKIQVPRLMIAMQITRLFQEEANQVTTILMKHKCLEGFVDLVLQQMTTMIGQTVT